MAAETVRAILRPDFLAAVPGGDLRFCDNGACEVVYFGGAGWIADKAQTSVRVGLKEAEDPIPLCYCFGFSRGDVLGEVAETGACAIPARIAAEVKAGRCTCEVKNPSGACCLGEVRKAVKQALETSHDVRRAAATGGSR